MINIERRHEMDAFLLYTPSDKKSLRPLIHDPKRRCASAKHPKIWQIHPPPDPLRKTCRSGISHDVVDLRNPRNAPGAMEQPRPKAVVERRVIVDGHDNVLALS